MKTNKFVVLELKKSKNKNSTARLSVIKERETFNTERLKISSQKFVLLFAKCNSN